MSRAVIKSYLIVCDHCGAQFANGDEDNGADSMTAYRQAARKAGWYSGVGNTDYCFNCSYKVRRMIAEQPAPNGGVA